MEDENVKKNPDVELKEFKIVCKYYDKNDDDENAKEIDLPTAESLEKLCFNQIVKDVLSFDIIKFKSFLEVKKEEEEGEIIEKTILNLDKLTTINKELLPYILIFIGGINSNSDIYNFFDDTTVKSPNEESFIDNSINYLEYVNSIIDFLKAEKLSVSFSELDLLFKALEELGINIFKEDKNTLYRAIKDSFLSMEKNKILVIIAPSNNFWIKSESNTINEQNYDIKLNNHNNIFYNKKFIEKFLKKITKHPRCTFGLICSMNKNNLKKCWDGLEKQFSVDCPKKVILFDQTDHKVLMLDPNKKKPTFFRDMEKIKERLKKEKNSDNKKKDNQEEENQENFDEKNIIILESEENKESDNTKNNSIYVNLFSEEYLKKDEKGKEAIDIQGNTVINYLYKLLENCTDDIRDYINRNKLDEKYSKE